MENLNKPTLPVISIGDLLQEEAPKRRFFIDPILHDGCLGMVYAAPGVGKTFFSLWLAGAAAGQGDFLKWKSSEKARVLYVDGEMGKDLMRERATQLGLSAYNLTTSSIMFVTPEMFKAGCVPHINDPRGQALYEQYINNNQIDVVFFDNYGCVTYKGERQTDEGVWQQTSPWLVKLRAQGKAIVLVHHAGKSGQQLGSSMKEQPLNWMIRLEAIKSFDDQDAAKFWVHFDKPLRIRAASAQSFFAEFSGDSETIRWAYQTARERKIFMIRHLLDMGLSKFEITDATNFSRAEVMSLIREIQKENNNGGFNTTTRDRDEDAGVEEPEGDYLF